MSPATVHRLSERLRHIQRPDEQLREVAKDVEALEILARTNAEAQRATGDAVAAIADALDRGLATQADQGERLERIEDGLLEVLAAVGRIERRLDGREASDVDLLARVEREQAAREAEDARILGMIQRSVAPIVADATSTAVVAAQDAAADQASGTRKVVAAATGAITAVATIVQILREAGVLR